MSYSVTTHYDKRIPSWQKVGPFRLIACHDTEGGTGKAGALGTIQFFLDTPERGASYHELWWYHETTDEFGVIRIVPTNRAAGSVAPQPDKYTPTAWVKDSLGPVWQDPNQGIYAVSIAGKVADADRYSKNPKFIAHAHRRMMELWKELGVNRRAEHAQFNPKTRSDWGKLLMPALGGLVTSDRFQPTETAMDWINNIEAITPAAVVVRAGCTYRLAPDLTTGGAVELAYDSNRILIGKVKGVDFGKGPNWFVLVSGSGGLKVVHEQDIKSGVNLVNPAPLQEKVNDLTAKVAALAVDKTTLTTKVTTQTDIIAGLKTNLSEAEMAAAAALARAEDAEEAAGGAVALRTALRDFLA